MRMHGMRSRRRGSAFAIALLVVVFGFSSTLRAQSTASSSAFGAAAGVSVNPVIGPTITATVGPLPNASGSAPPAYSADQSVASAGLSTVLTGTLLGTGVLRAEAQSSLPASESVLGRATIDGVGISLPVLLSLTADTVQATASITNVGGVATPAGSTLLTNPRLSGVLGIGLSISANPAPNTVLINTLGVRLVLNEQIITGAGTISPSISVNAIHLSLENVLLTGIGRITADIIVGHAQAQMTQGPTIAITQSVSPSSVTTGGDVTYTIVITNNGSATAQVTSVKDVIPASFTFLSSSAGTPAISGNELTFASPFTLAPGASRTITITARTGSTTGTFTANASVSGSNFSTVSTGPVAPVTVNAPPAAGSISGTVTSGVTGAPLGGATVTIRDSGGNVIATTTTAPNGTYSLPNLPPGTYTATFSAPGYQTSTQPVTVPAGTAVTLNAALTPLPGTITGTIVDQVTGLPVPGATVTLTQGTTTTTVTTDTNGNYVIPNVPADVPGTITVTHPNFEPSAPILVTVPPGGTVDIDVGVQPLPSTIHGLLLDGSTNQPIAGATITLRNGSGVVIATATSGSDGRYTFNNVVEGTYTIDFAAPGYIPESASLTIGPNATVNRTDSLDPNDGTVSGTVTSSATGAPIAGATVSLTQGGVTRTTTTDANGHYSFPDVDANVPATLGATAPNYVPSDSITVTLPPGGGSTQNIHLQPLPSSVHGMLLDSATGQPIAGATIALRNSSGVIVATTLSGSDGRYTFNNVVEGTYTLDFSAPGYISATVTQVVAPNQTINRTDSLEPNDGTISGTVTSSVTGVPLAGVTVTITQGGVTRTTTTDANGHYVFTDVEAGVPATLTASDPDYAPSTPVTVTLPPGGGSTVNLQLQPLPSTINGTINDASNGSPIAGATVRLRDSSGTVIATATTDSSGHYQFTNVVEGNYTLELSASGYVTRTVVQAVGANATITRTDSLTPNDGVISGTVTSAATGAPIAGATVSLTQSGVTRTTQTDAFGNYSFANVTPNVAASVSANAPHYNPSAPVSVSIAPGSGATQNFQLQPMPSTLSGVLLDSATNAPIAGATVRLRDSGGTVVATVTTGSDGRYTFSNVVEGTYTLDFSATGYISETATQAVGPAAIIDRTDSLDPNGGTISGTVTNATNGAPIAGATVTLTQSGVTRTTTTDANGHYTFANVTPSVPATLQATAPGFATSAPATVTIAPGSGATQNLQLQPLPGGINGHVTDAATTAPITGASVQLFDGGGTLIAQTTTAADGSYSLPAVAPGTYTLHFSAANYQPAASVVTVAQNATQTVDRALQPNGGSVSGLVTDARTGAPIAGALVTLNDGSTPRTTTTDSSGRYHFDNVAAGVSLTVTASEPRYDSATTPAFTLPAGGSATRDLQLSPRNGHIIGHVTDAVTGSSLASVTVRLLASNGDLVATTTTNSTGNYSFDSVVPGSYNLEFSRDGYLSVTEAALVAPDSTVTVNVQMVPRAGSVSGTVRDAVSGLPIGGATVTLVSGGSTRTTLTNASGAYAFASVAANVASTLQATHPGYVDGTVVTFTLVADGSHQQDLELQPRPGSITGSVTSASEGLPLAGVQVVLRDANGATIGTATTTASGTFTFNTLTPGAYTLSFSLDGYVPATASANVVANSQTIVNQSLSSVGSVLPGGISGTVRDAVTGQVLTGAMVVLTQDGRTRTTTTDANGNYSFSDVTPNVPATVTASRDDYDSLTSGAVTIPPNGSARVDLALQPRAGVVQGRVTDSVTSAALADVEVRLLDSGGNLLGTTLTDASGSYRFSGVRAGAVRLVFTLTGYNTGHGAANVAPSSTAVVDVQLVPLDANNPGVDPEACTNAAPLISVPEQIILPAGAPVRFEVGAVDQEGDNVTVTVEGLPSCGTYDAVRQEVFIPGDCWNGIEKWQILVKATDGNGTRITPVKLSIGQVAGGRRRAVRGNDAPLTHLSPIISAPPDPIRVVAGTTIDMLVLADSQVAGCAATMTSRLPAGSSFDPLTGRFYFAPQVTAADTTVVALFEATDCTGLRSSAAVTLVVTGTADEQAIFPISLLDFGQVEVGNLSAPVGLPVHNHGSDQLEIIGVSVSDDRFVIEGAASLPVALRTGDVLDLDVRFKPTAEGPVEAVLTLLTSDSETPTVEVALHGNGVALDRDGAAPDDRLPILLAPRLLTVAEGETLSFLVTAVDPEGQSVTVSTGALHDGSTFDAATGLFAFTAPDRCSIVGRLVLVPFRARTADGREISSVVSIRIHARSTFDAHPAPVVSVPTRGLVVRPGERLLLPLVARAQENDCTLSLSATVVGFTSFNTANGVLALVPTSADLGEVATIAVHATDCEGRTSVTHFTVTVGNGSVISSGTAAVSIERLELLAPETRPGATFTVPLTGAMNGTRRILSVQMRDGEHFRVDDALLTPVVLSPGQEIPITVRVVSKPSAGDTDVLLIRTDDPLAPQVTVEMEAVEP